jgi:hypothetical protein
MLEMKKKCEHCSVDLPMTSEVAMICSFECTFCSRCADQIHHGVCPNCEGMLIKRPTRLRDESCSIDAMLQSGQHAQKEG